MYKGDVTPQDAFEKLQADAEAVLIDVRTIPEWNYVGVPAVERLLRVEWNKFPNMDINADFIDHIESAGVGKDAHVFTLCRSGVRSIAAAEALTAAGFTNAFNVLEGFEGDKNTDGQRGSVGGWKVAGLPWHQG